MLRRLAIPVWAACLAALPLPAAEAKPARILSLDFCADQFVLQLADRDRILALSPDSERAFSYLREAARGLPQVRPTAEEVLLRKPDLVVRSYGGGPNAGAFFARAGLPVLQLGWSGDLESMKRTLGEVAAGLGEPERGARLVEEIDARLAGLERPPEQRTALYLTPSGATTGPGTLIDEMLGLAGYENFQQRSGWGALPLERLAYEQPDLVAAAFFDRSDDYTYIDAWSPMRHPLTRARLRELPVVQIPGAWTACGGWFLLDAIEALAAAGR